MFVEGGWADISAPPQTVHVVPPSNHFQQAGQTIVGMAGIIAPGRGGMHRRDRSVTRPRGRLPWRAVLTAFLLIVCEPQRIAGVGRSLADIDGITEVYTTTGGADFIALARIPDIDALATLVTERVARLEGIVRTDTHLAIRSYGRSDEAAAFDIGVE